LYELTSRRSVLFRYEMVSNVNSVCLLLVDAPGGSILATFFQQQRLRVGHEQILVLGVRRSLVVVAG
jgi:hypothetical protein